MSKEKLEKLIKDSFTYGHLPENIRIPALGDNHNEVIKPLETATLDDIAFAAQALDQESDALYSRLSALRRLYREARSRGALGSDNIIDALSRKGGVQ